MPRPSHLPVDTGFTSRAAACIMAVMLATACGGGDPTVPPTPGPTDAQRAQAATDTAQSVANACAGIRPFYWEI